MVVPEKKISKYRNLLKARMDPDKVLDWLLARTILCHEEVEEVKCRSTNSQRNEKLLNFVIEKDEEEEFINALRDANQQHLANYLLNDGVRCQNILGDWPLEEAQIKTIDVNCGSLKDLIDMEGDLADRLMSKRVINHRQKQLICSKATDSEKNDAFLDILRRGSLGDYENTIQCLRDSNQGHIAEILEKGGACSEKQKYVLPPGEYRRTKNVNELPVKFLQTILLKAAVLYQGPRKAQQQNMASVCAKWKNIDAVMHFTNRAALFKRAECGSQGTSARSS